MRTPEEALAAARQRAAETSAGSGQALSAEGAGPARGQQPVSLTELAGWALIEPDEAEVYSTRRLGAPITALKRLLIRLMRQYLVEVTAQQSRFNAHLLGHLIDLDRRVQRLEQAAFTDDSGRPAPADGSGGVAPPDPERRPR